MAFTSGTVTGSALNNDSSGHKVLLNTIRTFVETMLPTGQNWVTQRVLQDSWANIVSITHSANIATVLLDATPLMVAGDTILISGATDPLYNGLFTITSVAGVSYTYTMSGTPSANASGTLIATRQNWEVIWKAPGISGTEEIYCGIKTYQSATSDYYNFEFGVFTGYIASNSFESQAGSSSMLGATLWNQDIDYWLVANGQRLMVVVKILDVYESFYLGKYLPYATPTQYPYPVCIWSSITSKAPTRYSDTTLVSGFKGTRSNFQIRTADGAWKTPDVYPYASVHQLRNTINLSTTAVGYYGLHSLVISDNSPNVYGELDGVYYISGFNNATENTIVYGGITYICFRDRRSVGFNDYIAVRLS
jgi:hypothetical protein